MAEIIVFAESLKQTEMISAALSKAGFSAVCKLLGEDAMNVGEPLPSAIVVDIARPSSSIFIEDLAALSLSKSIPAIVFTQDETRGNIERAVQLGIAAYVVNGFEAGRVRAIIHVALARFRAFQNLTQELSKKERLLSERKILERAKGILMEERGLTENDAFVALRKTAMESGKPLIDVATQIIILAKFPLSQTSS